MQNETVDSETSKIGLQRGTVALHPPSTRWGDLFVREQQALARALDGLHAGIHHIGSTAIEGIPAKPILDIAVELRAPEDANRSIHSMEALGYVFRGSQGVEGRSYFVRGMDDVSYVHVHMFEQHHPTLRSYLAFRDHLMRDPRARERYVSAKVRLAAVYPNNRRAYQDEKRKLVRELLSELNGLDRAIERETSRSANADVYRNGCRVRSYQTGSYHATRLGMLESALSEALACQEPMLAALQVLELAAGAPTAALGLLKRGFRVLATDGDAAVVEELTHSGLEAMKVDIERPLPFADGTFRAVMMGEIIEHIFDTRALLEDCWRVLAPGGVLALTTPNLTTMQDRLRFLIGRSPRQVSPMHEYLRLHIRPFCANSLTAALAGTGFGNIRCASNYVVWRSGDRQLWRSRMLARLLPTLGGSLIVTATKRVSEP
jgi:GrpB-like predicted nucleotidyltransferase (UPF0157 family)/SAM-dependent methyltransferase